MRRTALVTVALLLFVGCGSTAPKSDSEADAFNKETEAAITRLKAKDSGLRKWFDEKSYGYVVFPDVGKGGLVVGGAHGRGQVYEQGEHIGFAELAQGTIGAQVGGQLFGGWLIQGLGNRGIFPVIAGGIRLYPHQYFIM